MPDREGFGLRFVGSCPFCGHDIDGPVYRTTICPGCGRELHCCLACRFHSLGAHHDCKEDAAEFVQDKERANFCELFFLADKPAVRQDKDKRLKDKAAFDKLFNF